MLWEEDVVRTYHNTNGCTNLNLIYGNVLMEFMYR